MADLQLTITAGGRGNRPVPLTTFSGKVLNSDTGAVLYDFTGANQIEWPTVIDTLTATQQRQLAEIIAKHVIYMVSGVSV